MQSKLALDEGMLRQAIFLFKETKHFLLANMSAIGSGSVREFRLSFEGLRGSSLVVSLSKLLIL